MVITPTASASSSGLVRLKPSPHRLDLNGVKGWELVSSRSLLLVLPLRRWLQDTSKRKLADFLFFSAPPPSCFPRVHPSWPDDWSKQALRIKKSGWLNMLAGFTRKKASTRRVNRKIADSTRNQRVFVSRYLAANYIPSLCSSYSD